MTEEQFYEFIAGVDALTARLRKDEQIAIAFYGFPEEDEENDIF